MKDYFIRYEEIESLLKLARNKEERDILLSLALDFYYDDPNEFYSLVRLGLPKYRELMQLKLMREKNVGIITRIATYKVDIFNKQVKAKLENGQEVIIPSSVLNRIGSNLEEIYENLSNPLYMEIAVSGKEIIVEYMEVFKKEVDVKAADEVIRECNDIPAVAFLLGLGIPPNYPSLRQYLPRMLPLVRVFYRDFNPLIHVIQLTGYNTGKTAYAVRLQFLYNAGYFQGIPKPAALVFDGSRMIKGAVFTRELIIIDEIDKQARTVGNKDQDIQKTLSTMVSGLENGIWTREVRGAEFLQSERRFVPFLLMGNTEAPLCMGESVREHVKQAILDRLSPDTAGALDQRFALMDLAVDSYNVTSNLLYTYLPNSIMRGIIRIVEEKAQEIKVEEKTKDRNRYTIHAVKIAKALSSWLNEEVSYEESEKAVLISGFNVFQDRLMNVVKKVGSCDKVLELLQRCQ